MEGDEAEDRIKRELQEKEDDKGWKEEHENALERIKDNMKMEHKLGWGKMKGCLRTE